MIKKKYILTLFLLIILVLSLSNVSAFFTKSHEYWILKALQDEPDSAVAKLCGEHPEWLIDGNTAADVFVLHYTDKDKVQSYVFTHQLNSFNECLRKAGSDVEQKCKCYGRGSHIVQDHLAHGYDGLVPKYISRYLSSNLIGHMRIEDSYELKHMKLISSEPIYNDLQFYDSIVLNSIIGDERSITLLSEGSGLSYSEVERDINIFAVGYKGEGFYNTVYKDKVQIPGEAMFVIIGIIAYGLIGILLVLFLPIKKTNWKFLIIFLQIIIVFVGILLAVSLYTGDTWQWVRVALKVVPINVDDSDIKTYNDLALANTKQYFRTGEILVEDASGLSYRDSQGNWIEGPLSQAEVPFKIFLIVGIIPFMVLLYTFLFYKTFVTKKNPRINKFINIIGIIIGGIIGFLIIADILLILINL